MVGFGGRADAAVRRMARLQGRSPPVTQRIGTRWGPDWGPATIARIICK